MSRRFIFDCPAATWNGLTTLAATFSMPSPLPAQDPLTGWTTIPMTSSCGIIDPTSLSTIIGVGGCKVTCCGTTIGNGAVARLTVGIIQPRPGVAYAGSAVMVQPLLIRTSNTGTLIRRSAYMPPGYIIYLLAEDGGGNPVAGPYSLQLEFEPLATKSELLKALESQDFPCRQVLVTP